METGYDILFFWVARMIMLGIYRTHKVPFKTVYLHGLVRDGFGHKMSKSKGNVINPLAVSQIYGTDALRMALVFGSTPGTDIALSEDKIEAMRNFANKIWNASRFVLSFKPTTNNQQPTTNEDDKWILKELKNIIKSTTEDIEKFRLGTSRRKFI
jgi:valyl-tRNA synthetase